MADTIATLNAALQGRYVVERELGAGGMAHVYLADDLKHQRRVAIKVLRPELAAVIGPERFGAEIKTTANLQHPHILPLHDSGEADGSLFYVMPYVEGESLRDRLNREHVLPVADAVRMVIDLSEALEYAHGHGVVHRDIKPANILMQAGRPLIADFGIALATRGAEEDRLTRTGFSLGTPVYMSPEQAAGEPFVTASADIYSLACVLYEMLTGEPPFDGSTSQAILGKIMTGDAPVASAKRKTVPPNVDAAIRKALEKVPADRFANAKEFAAALSDPSFRLSRDRHAGASVGARWKPIALAAGVALVAVTAVAVAGWMRPEAPRPVSRYAMTPVGPEAIPEVFGPSIAVAPDGSSFAYAGLDADGGTIVWVKEREAAHARRLPGTESVQQVFYYPDSRRIGFLTLDAPDPRAVKVVSLDNGEVVTLVAEGFLRTGASVGPDGKLYLTTPDLRISTLDLSGNWVPVTHLAEGEESHMAPHVLPGGAGLLMEISRGAWQIAETDVAVVDLATGVHRVLIGNALQPRYSTTGHVIAVRADGTLIAAPFDEDRLELRGPVVPLFGGVKVGQVRGPGYGVDFDLSREGTLVYVSDAGTGRGEGSRIESITKDGARGTVAPDWIADFESIAISPDGRRLAATIGNFDSTGVWVLDLATGTRSALTFSSGMNRRPVWSGDGEQVLFISDRGGSRAAYSRRADGSGEAELVLSIDGKDVDEVAISSDGRWLVYRTGTTARDRDVYALPRGGDPADAVVISALAEIDELMPAISPDGRYVAYVSDETGESVAWVRTFPDPSAGRWRISDGSGLEPVWSADGKELFYRNEEGLFSVEVVTDPVFRKGATRLLSEEASTAPTSPYLSTSVYAAYDSGPDSDQFLLIRKPDLGARELIVVENFFEELRGELAR